MASTPQNAAPAQQKLEESLVGRRVHKYDIVRSVGRGGMGMVFEAVNTAIGKRVAMKFVDAELAKNKDAIARFHREAQAASAVESAHIVEIFDSGFTDDDIPYIVMELLRGEDLGHRIKRCGRLELAEALYITAQILRGLHRAHEAGIVHRDLKPDNIFLVDRDDDPSFVKILDFGISKVQRGGDVPAHTLTRQGTVLGTPFYMSPEQAQALPDIDGRADLWSVGAILYECLTGHPPHTGNTYEQVIVNICMKDAENVRKENPAVPEAVARVIAKALARERAERFSSARELLDALVGAAPDVLSSRVRLSSGEEAGSKTAAVRGSTPVAITPAGGDATTSGLGPTLEVGGGSKVGWSTSSRAAALGPRRRAVAAIAALSVVAGIAVAVLYRQRSETTPQDAAQPPSEIALELRANVPGARFSVGGIDLPGGVLRGRSGETKRVRVEAEGYTPMDMEVLLQPGDAPVEVQLEPLPPTVTPATAPADTAQPAATSAASAEPTASAAASPRPPQRPGTPGRPGSSRPPTPTPEPTGIGGGLKLKTY
jgi:serine/threonine-protein kinase